MNGHSYDPLNDAARNHAEHVVRRYLTHLHRSNIPEPAAANVVPDKDDGDLIERLKLHARIETAAENYETALVEEFVAVAKTYAVTEHITAGAFLSLGVPRDVLERAGILPTTVPTPASAAGTSRPAENTQTTRTFDRPRTRRPERAHTPEHRPFNYERAILLTLALISVLGALLIGAGSPTPHPSMNLVLLPVLLFAPGYVLASLFQFPTNLRILVAPPLSVAASIATTWIVNLLGQHGTNIPTVTLLAVSALCACTLAAFTRPRRPSGTPT